MTPGHRAYEAWRRHWANKTGGRLVHTRWAELFVLDRDAWEAAARAVAEDK